MSWRLAYPDEVSQVKIDWTKPILIESFMQKQITFKSDANFYKITGKFSNFDQKLFYIGKVYDQTVRQRMAQPDHKRRVTRLGKENPKHELLISLGSIVSKEEFKTRKRINEVESLLIYAHWTEDMINEKKVYTCALARQLCITNTGSRSPLYRTVFYGAFINEN